jgi:chromosome segregation ATPase
MAAENTPDTEYQGVLTGLEDFSELFETVLVDLDVGSIKRHSETVSTQSQDQMDLLNRLKKRIENLNQEIQSKRESNEDLEDGVNIGLKAQKDLLESKLNLELRLDHATTSNKELKANLDILSGLVEKSRSALLQARSEAQGFKTELEASRAEAVTIKSQVADLESGMADATNAGSAESVLNADLKVQLSTLQASCNELKQSKNVAVAARESVLVQNAALKAEVASLQGQVASDKTRINFLETTLAAGGDSSATLTEEVQRLESVRQVDSRAHETSQQGLVEARNETQGLKTELEASRAEAVTIKSRVADLESRLDKAINAGSAASVVNADLKADLSTLQESYNKLHNESRKMKFHNEALQTEILALFKQREEEEQAEGVEEEEEGDYGPILDPSPVSSGGVAFLPVVNFVDNTPNDIFVYIKENVYLDEGPDIRFKSTLTQKGRQGIKLTEQNLQDLIDALRTAPLAAFGGNRTYKHQLQNYQFWGPNPTVSYEVVARRKLGL